MSQDDSQKEKLPQGAFPVLTEEADKPPVLPLSECPIVEQARNPYADKFDAIARGEPVPSVFENAPVTFSEDDSQYSLPSEPGEMSPLLNPRHEQIAQLAAMGLETSVIAEELRVTLPWASHVKNLPETVSRTQYLQEKLWNKNHKARFQKSIGTSLDVLESVIKEGSKEKTRDKIDVAKFLLEKTTGKAPAVIEVKGELLVSFLDKLDSMRNVTPTREAGGPLAERIEEAKTDSIDTWVKDNL